MPSPLSDGSVQQLGKNRSLNMKDGKYYLVDPSLPAADAETLMRQRYGLPPKNPGAAPANVTAECRTDAGSILRRWIVCRVALR